MKLKDIDKILEAQLISPSQRDAIVEHFRLNEKWGARWLLICFSALAAGLIVAGIIMLVSANWYNVPAIVKMTVAMLMLVAIWCGWLKWRDTRPILSEVLGFCWGGMWLACISLYGQIFQLQNPFVEGWTLFFAGIVLIPFICRQRFLIWVVVVASVVELVALGENSRSYLSFGNYIPDYDNDYLPYLVVLLLGFWWALGEKWRVASERWCYYRWISVVILTMGMVFAQFIMYPPHVMPDAGHLLPLLSMAALPAILLAFKPKDIPWMPWVGVSAVISMVLPCGLLVDMLPTHLPGIIIYFVMALTLMFSGVRALRLSWINIGAVMVVFAAIALMADVLDSYTFSGVVLVLAGLLMLGLGILLEKSRRHLIRSVKNNKTTLPQA